MPVQAQFALLLLGPVALEAGTFEEGLDVLLVGHALLGGGGGQLAGVEVGGRQADHGGQENGGSDFQAHNSKS